MDHVDSGFMVSYSHHEMKVYGAEKTHVLAAMLVS